MEAGPSSDEWRRLVEAGLYDPEQPAASERRELLAYILERSSVDEVLEWSRWLPVVGIPAAVGARPGQRITALQAAERAGVPVDTVVSVRRALGFPVTDPDVASLPETVVDDIGVYLLGSELFGADPALAFARVLGWATARIAEAARALFASSLTSGPAGPTELETAKANELAMAAWREVISLVGRLMAEHTAREESFMWALTQGHLRLAVAFVDLVGSTAWTEKLTPAAHGAALARFEDFAWRIASDQMGRVVKLIGDEAMIVADDPEAACRIAYDLCASVGSDPQLPAARGAVGYGTVTARAGDYFGPLVNLVARATKHAAPGQVVATSDAARVLDPARWSADDRGVVTLKGIAEPVLLFAVAPLSLATTDPD